MAVATPSQAPTRIVKDGGYTTEITFFHTDEADQEAVVRQLVQAAEALARQPGMHAVNVLRSNDGSRACTYIQWRGDDALAAAHRAIQPHTERLLAGGALENQPLPRRYEVVYTDDRSVEGVSVIAADYAGAIFINEITTRPATQARLLELVIANNEIQSQHTPGYRSANFHRSDDGERAVNYSLWDSEEHCIEAISRMADMDENLEETVELASPDFRFYTLAFAAHA